MKYCKKKPVVVKFMTFDELIAYAKVASPAPHWSFEINGHPITHENDDCYIIATLEGIHNMTRQDVLIIGVKGEIYPCKIEVFEATYEVLPDLKLGLIGDNK
jgi:hypothetical protein